MPRRPLFSLDKSKPTSGRDPDFWFGWFKNNRTGKSTFLDWDFDRLQMRFRRKK